MSRLIQKAKTSPKAFMKLYETHVEAVYQYCLTRARSTAEAEDLCSEVWESALSHIQELKSDHPTVFRAWLFKIAKHCIYKYWESKKTPLAPEEALEKIPSTEAKPDELSQKEEAAKTLHKLVNALPEQQRETVALHFFSELRNKEIAILMELSEKTVASNLSRALKTLQGWLKNLQ